MTLTSTEERDARPTFKEMKRAEHVYEAAHERVTTLEKRLAKLEQELATARHESSKRFDEVLAAEEAERALFRR